MTNVLLGELPTEWNGYKLNTWYQIGIQLMLLFDDDTLSDFEKDSVAISLLFGEDDDTIRDYPANQNEFVECITYFLGGWNQDGQSGENSKEKIMCYNVDQGRIYADFLLYYGINLKEADLHWWEFQWLLWSLPQKASFMQAIQIRTKKPSKNASAEERKAIAQGKKIYGLDRQIEYSSDEKRKIDEYDKMMEKRRQKRVEQEEALRIFEGGNL